MKIKPVLFQKVLGQGDLKGVGVVILRKQLLDYRIPVLVRSAVIIGSVKMELTGYQGLAGVPPSLVP